MVKNLSNVNNDDFNLKDILKVKVEDHDKELESLAVRLTCFEDKFGDTLKIAETLKNTSENAAKFQEIFSDNLIKVLNNDKAKNMLIEAVCNHDGFKTLINKQIEEANKNKMTIIFMGAWKWALGLATAIILLFIGKILGR
jgi:hypothetical protein